MRDSVWGPREARLLRGALVGRHPAEALPGLAVEGRGLDERPTGYSPGDLLHGEAAGLGDAPVVARHGVDVQALAQETGVARHEQERAGGAAARVAAQPGLVHAEVRGGVPARVACRACTGRRAGQRTSRAAARARRRPSSGRP